jgi:hypothetical protein
VDTDVARKHSLELAGGREGTGAGKGTYHIAYATHVAFRLGDSVTVTPDSCYVIDLSGLPATVGRHVAGIIGYDFFARYVVDVDHDAQILRVYDKGSYRYTGDGSVLPLTFHKKVPYITAAIKVNGRRPSIGEFLVDSGSGDAVDHDITQSRGEARRVGSGSGTEYHDAAAWSLSARQVRDRRGGCCGGKAMIGNQVLGRFRLFRLRPRADGARAELSLPRHLKPTPVASITTRIPRPGNSSCTTYTASG